MINIEEMVLSLKKQGYSENDARNRTCQSVILMMISRSRFKRTITMKGGIVMRCVSKDRRRATEDIDFDFIRYPLKDKEIFDFIHTINNTDGIEIRINGKPKDLRQQNYKGKRIYVTIADSYNNELTTKIDIGVHKYLNIEQEEIYFDLALESKGVYLLANSCEQIIAEKLKSLMKFGYQSTRYKDVFDIYYLSFKTDKKKLLAIIRTLIFNDEQVKENTVDEILLRLNSTFKNEHFMNELKSPKFNWIEVPIDDVMKRIFEFITELKI